MNMWYAIIEKATGRLHSIGTVLADPMPKEYEVKELGESFNQEGLEWDPATRTFVPDHTWTRIYAKLAAEPWAAKLAVADVQRVKDFIYKLLTEPTI